MKKIVFICTGNTCRSPMAEGLFRAYLLEKNMDFIEVSSAGLAAAAGAPPSDNAVLAAKKLGADISAHRSRGLTQYDLQEKTYFVCMTEEHASVLRRYVSAEHIIALQVSDPYMGGYDVYLKCAEQIIGQFDAIFHFVFGFDELRSMQACDISAIAEIERQCFAHPWTEEQLREEPDNPTARFYAVIINSRAVAYIGANNIAGEVYITNVAVLPEYRGKGFASCLMGVLLSVSSKEKAEFVSLEVRESNQTAIRLYEKLGFAEQGRRKRFYRDPEEDALIYTHNFLK